MLQPRHTPQIRPWFSQLHFSFLKTVVQKRSAKSQILKNAFFAKYGQKLILTKSNPFLEEFMYRDIVKYRSLLKKSFQIFANLHLKNIFSVIRLENK